MNSMNSDLSSRGSCSPKAAVLPQMWGSCWAHCSASVILQEQSGLLLLFPNVHGKSVGSFGISLYLQIFFIHCLWLARTYSWSCTRLWHHDIPVAMRPPIRTDTFTKAKLDDFHHLPSFFFLEIKSFLKLLLFPFEPRTVLQDPLVGKIIPIKIWWLHFKRDGFIKGNSLLTVTVK